MLKNNSKRKQKSKLGNAERRKKGLSKTRLKMEIKDWAKVRGE